MGLQLQPLLCAGPARSRRSWEPLLTWSLRRVKCGKRRERGGGTRLTLPFRGKHHDENWAMAVRPGLDSQLNHFLDV